MRDFEIEETFILAATMDPCYKARSLIVRSTGIQAKRTIISLITHIDSSNEDNIYVESLRDQDKIFTGIWGSREFDEGSRRRRAIIKFVYLS